MHSDCNPLSKKGNRCAGTGALAFMVRRSAPMIRWVTCSSEPSLHSLSPRSFLAALCVAAATASLAVSIHKGFQQMIAANLVDVDRDIKSDLDKCMNPWKHQKRAGVDVLHDRN